MGTGANNLRSWINSDNSPRLVREETPLTPTISPRLGSSSIW